MKLKTIAKCTALALALNVSSMQASVPTDLQSVGNELGTTSSTSSTWRMTSAQAGAAPPRFEAVA